MSAVAVPSNGPVDVAIVGGGPAGLSAALVLSRARRSVVVFDGGTPRNHASPAVHGFLSRDGVAPGSLRSEAWSQIEPYGYAHRISSTVDAISRVGDAFEVVAGSGERLRARTVILAVGMHDLLPPIPGLMELWGESVIHCPFCYGWENAGGHWGVLARSDAQAAGALVLLAWSRNVRVFVPRDVSLSPATVARLADAGIPLDRRSIRAFAATPAGRLGGVEVDGGATVLCDAFVLQPAQRQTALVRDLGLDLDPDGRVVVDDAGRTSHPGIYAAGDLVGGRQSVAAAVASGSSVAMALVGELVHRAVPRRFAVADGSAALWLSPALGAAPVT